MMFHDDACAMLQYVRWKMAVEETWRIKFFAHNVPMWQQKFVKIGLSPLIRSDALTVVVESALLPPFYAVRRIPKSHSFPASRLLVLTT